MDEQQQRAWERAVERKKEESREASEQQGHGDTRPPKDLGEGTQHSVVANRDQDEPVPNQKGTRHGQVTAENWNQ